MEDGDGARLIRGAPLTVPSGSCSSRTGPGTDVEAREIMTARASPARGSPVHPVAYGFSAAATRFEHGRPGYPTAAVSHLLDVLRITAGSIVVELGAGTGKLTRALASAGARIIAVEPLPEMRQRLLAAVPGVPVLGAVAEALPLATGSVDVLVAAQSWHWFDGALALLEADRVLMPGGSLGLVWSAYDESIPWLGELAAIRARRAIQTIAPAYGARRSRKVRGGGRCGSATSGTRGRPRRKPSSTTYCPRASSPCCQARNKSPWKTRYVSC